MKLRMIFDLFLPVFLLRNFSPGPCYQSSWHPAWEAFIIIFTLSVEATGPWTMWKCCCTYIDSVLLEWPKQFPSHFVCVCIASEVTVTGTKELWLNHYPPRSTEPWGFCIQDTAGYPFNRPFRPMLCWNRFPCLHPPAPQLTTARRMVPMKREKRKAESFHTHYPHWKIQLLPWDQINPGCSPSLSDGMFSHRAGMSIAKTALVRLACAAQL